MSRFDSITRALDFLAGLAGFVALLFMGQWWLILLGFIVMGVGSGGMTALLIPVERAFAAVFAGGVPISMGLRSRRPTLLYVGALIYAGGLFALWCSGVLSYFSHSAEGGARLVALVWSVSVAMAPVRTKDHFTPLLLPIYSSVARGGYLVMAVVVALVELDRLVLLGTFGLMMVGAAFAHQYWSERVGQRIMDSMEPAASEDGDESAVSVTFFPASSEASRALMDALTELVRAEGYEVRMKPEASQEELWTACVGNGAVIFDATREEGDDANYRRAMYVLQTDYAIPVSRNYLPANFPHFSPIAPPYPHTWDNNVLVASASERLREMRDLLPRKRGHRGWRSVEALMEHALERAKERRRHEYDVFLSYRGCHEEAVKRMVRRGPGEAGHRIRYFSAGELALHDEILSLQRRWHVLRILQRWIATAREFWIYGTEDYLDSWWTRGELILLARMDPAARPALRIYDPTTDSLGEPPDGLTPRLDERQREIMDRFLFFAQQPEWSVRVRETLGDSLFATMLGGRGELFDRSFVDDPLLQCATCTAAIESVGGIDAGEFIELRYPALHRIPPSRIEAALAGGTSLECPRCGTGYTVSIAPPRFWWYPERNGVGTGPAGVVLEERPTYRALTNGQRRQDAERSTIT